MPEVLVSTDHQFEAALHIASDSGGGDLQASMTMEGAAGPSDLVILKNEVGDTVEWVFEGAVPTPQPGAPLGGDQDTDARPLASFANWSKIISIIKGGKKVYDIGKKGGKALGIQRDVAVLKELAKW